MTITTEIRSNDSAAPHRMNFFNTFKIQQTSEDQSLVLTSALGRTSAAPAAAEVPEPATGVLLLTGLLGAVARRRKNRRAAASAAPPTAR